MSSVELLHLHDEAAAVPLALERAEPILKPAAARARILPPVHVSVGTVHKTLVLQIPGLFVALVQPRRRAFDELNLAAKHAKADLDALMETANGFDQGVVYLPRYAVIRRSPQGAQEMARRRLTHAVEPLANHADLLDGALDHIATWLRADRVQLGQFNNFGRKMQALRAALNNKA